MDEGDLGSAGGVQAGEDEVPDGEVTSDPEICTVEICLIGSSAVLGNMENMVQKCTHVQVHRVIHLPYDLGWVDFDLGVPPSCLAAHPLLPNSNQPRRNWADSGIPKIPVNPTQVLGQMNHPVVDKEMETVS